CNVRTRYAGSAVHLTIAGACATGSASERFAPGAIQRSEGLYRPMCTLSSGPRARSRTTLGQRLASRRANRWTPGRLRAARRPAPRGRRPEANDPGGKEETMRRLALLGVGLATLVATADSSDAGHGPGRGPRHPFAIGAMHTSV